METVSIGLLIPLLGTSLGAACVFFMKDQINRSVERFLLGFASGVMVGACMWSLLLPALEMGEGKSAAIPVVIGFWIGIGFLLLLDIGIPHLHLHSDKAEGPSVKLKKTQMMLLAVVLHNIPEGLAVGVVYSGLLAGGTSISVGGALALSLGIAIQNFPEGAIVSMPLHLEGESKWKSFLGGVLSGAVEPLAALITLFVTQSITPFMPYFLSFASGAMMYVVVEDLLPNMSEGEHSNVGVVAFALGFTLMMVLEAALG